MVRRANYDRLVDKQVVQNRFNVHLASCPFCGCENVALYASHMPHITCLYCGADGPIDENPTKIDDGRQFDAVQAWNKRVREW